MKPPSLLKPLLSLQLRSLLARKPGKHRGSHLATNMWSN
eukprot:CAMPEP_0177445450 /NCGR_PEP_ID=MMETSP0369-20130122/6545_1 /TAXON_ID=447022 ORGANISM="Scrippsiella hangoei-like, Strain SHHI-4" /NCGR_SAMPLE_ID=MMETSP0369 /ASSEMBLY_ACC=CAM_ASM_000364 /LENGTH=38 /DNA_ID= /DNA_START= /DNA_END= /DNA_ORIENTATION=